MKLTFIIITTFLLQVSANTFGQKISLSEKNASLERIIKKISLQTNYDFLGDFEILMSTRKLTLEFKNLSINEALAEIFRGSDITYTINGKSVVITKKEPDKNKVFTGQTMMDVEGIILDEKGKPLSGATVRIKGDSKSVVTDVLGRFFFRGLKKNDVLIISYIGYINKEVVIGNSSMLSISLELGTSSLEVVSVVSTGYQMLSKERATGSYNVVTGEQLEKPSTSIAQRLIGTTAGMQATLDAEGKPRFEIRGQTTLNVRSDFGVRNQNGAPLVVVDGFAIQGDFSTINPNDVESVTVLKDAAAASIWGARSANGVIVVVTKKGKKGTPLTVNFSAFTQISKKLDLDYVNPLATSAETIDYELKTFGNWGADVNSGGLYDVFKSWSPGTVALSEYNLGFLTESERDALLSRYRSLSNKDQIRDELLTNPSVQQYNLDISGSTEKMSNRMSILFEKNRTNFKGSDSKKYTLNYNLQADIFKWLQVSFGGLVNYDKSNQNGVNFNVNPYGSPNPLADIQGIAPYEMLRNEDGTLTNISNYYQPILDRLVPTAIFPYPDWSYNPIQEINNRKYTSEQINARLQAGLKFRIIQGLSFDTRVQYELFNTFNKKINNDQTFAVRDAVNTAASWDMATNRIILNLPKGGTLQQDRTRTESYIFRNQLNFERTFGQDHEINFIAGSEINNIVSEAFLNPIAYGYNEETLGVGTFPNGSGGPSFPVLNWLGFNVNFPYTNKFAYGIDRYFSLFGNAAYTYKGKYTLSGSVRTDASNLITDDPSYRYAPFWSLGLGWQLSKETFIQNVSWIDQLSLRATYGYNGNVDKSTSFKPLIALDPVPDLYSDDIIANISSYGNPRLRWEKTGSWNIGADYSMLKGKIYGKVDFYHKSGRDLIATLSIPSINGTEYQSLNNASMINKGVEVELGTVQRIKGNDITWNGNINFSFNKNRITKLFVTTYNAPTLARGGSDAYVEGLDANTIWRYQYSGVINGQPTVLGPDGTNYSFSGFPSGDGRDYLVRMGTEVAPYTLGFVNSFKVYDFGLSFIVTGKFGHKFQRKGFNYPSLRNRRVLPNSKISEVINGDQMKIAPLPLNPIEPEYGFWDEYHTKLSYLIENASHIRMQEINVSYSIPKKMTSKIGISRALLYVQGNDLFTVVANKAGEDPEYPLGTLKPQPRMSLGIRCEF